MAFEWFSGLRKGVRSIARRNFNGFEGFFGPKEGFYALIRRKPGHKDGLFIYMEGKLCKGMGPYAFGR